MVFYCYGIKLKKEKLEARTFFFFFSITLPLTNIYIKNVFYYNVNQGEKRKGGELLVEEVFRYQNMYVP